MKEKSIRTGILLDFYGNLLTDRMREACESYYYEDLSLAEIAELQGISRQGVHDTIKRAEKELESYEDKLGLMGLFEKNKARAQKALDLSGATPLSIAEAGIPGFADAAAHNVLWANIIVETNDIVQTGIVNWPSHMSSFYGDGYTGVGGTRWISSNLFSEISATDVRKGWWLNESLESPLLDAPGYSALKADIQALETPYQNVKFGTGDGTVTGLGAAAADWILMRAEELILIKAEGLAKSGGDGAGTLTQFVQANRDPSYNVGQHGLSLEDEIWWQRRVELWGEGFAWGDIVRLDKDIIRSNSNNWPVEWATQDVIGNHDVYLWRIPQAEIEANRGISEADNNPFVAF